VVAAALMTGAIAGSTVRVSDVASFRIALLQPGEIAVFVRDFTRSMAAAMKLNVAGGAVVSRLECGGLEQGDVILTVNGKPIRNRRDMESTMAAMPPGSASQLQIIRQGIPQEVVITAALEPVRQKPMQLPLIDTRPSQLEGVRVQNVTPAQAMQLGVPLSAGGVIITEVDLGTPAAAAGLKPGDVILEVNQRPVRDVEQFFEFVRELSGQLMGLKVSRAGVINHVIIPSQ
jgi:serine protease Do